MSNEDDKRDNDDESEMTNSEPATKSDKNFKPVVLSIEAYKTIILYASRYANPYIPSKDWKEIYGILIGRRDEDFVYVERAEALTFGHDTDVELDHRHLGFIATIEDELYNEGSGQYIVGWFHSHPGLGLFFSYIDLKNQLFFQTHEDGIGLVFDHTLLGKKKEDPIFDEEGKEHKMTKYETGFEIYRLTDVNMNSNAPGYDKNYHSVDYILKGLNKSLFANILAELSSLHSAGKPLQSAYAEDYKLESHYEDIDNIKQPDVGDLVNIPLSQEESADDLIYQGKVAFSDKKYDKAISLYKKGIEKFKKIGDFDRTMDLLRVISRKCTSNPNLFYYARDFAEELYEIANKYGALFYKGVANYILGYILLKENNPDLIEFALKKIEEAAVDFSRVNDYAGAGMCFNKIGTTFEKIVKNFGSACLYYREAIENYNKAIKYSHPLRITPWSKPEILIERIIELRDLIDVLLPEVENFDIRKKVIRDMKSIQYNF